MAVVWHPLAVLVGRQNGWIHAPVHYLLVQGKACCAHAYANFASHPLKYDDVVSEVHDLPWNEREGKHEFPASLGLG